MVSRSPCYSSFIAPELVFVPSLQTTPQAGEVKEIPLDSPAVRRDDAGRLTITFTGNRVVAVSDGKGDYAVDVLLDGKGMSSQKELWAATRPSTAPKMWMPAIKRISFENTPLDESWTHQLTIPAAGDKSGITSFRVFAPAAEDRD